MGYRTPVDIANRALQHCGARRISETLGFTEDSVNASECAFAWDKLRGAELRRNLWRCTIRSAVLRPIDTSTRLLKPVLYSSVTTYFVGSIVSDASGALWMSNSPDNVGNAPGNSFQWDAYFGPLAIPPWDTSGTTSYYSGDVVYVSNGAGIISVYMSREDNNLDNPATATAWAATSPYRKNAIVTYLGTPYQSLIDLNLNQTPSASPLAWSAATTYAIGNTVCASDGAIYTSLVNGNINHDPVTDAVRWSTAGAPCPWTRTLTRTSSSDKWLAIGAAVSELGIAYPLGSGPASNVGTKNAYRVPANYLRPAPQDPKAGSISPLGAPSGAQYKDWDFQGDYFTTRDSDPIIFHFGADLVDVTEMDPMLCEGLAARIAMAVCPKVTQSQGKMGEVSGIYQKFMSEARMVNAIETGAIEPPEDDYITCRV